MVFLLSIDPWRIGEPFVTSLLSLTSVKTKLAAIPIIYTLTPYSRILLSLPTLALYSRSLLLLLDLDQIPHTMMKLPLDLLSNLCFRMPRTLLDSTLAGFPPLELGLLPAPSLPDMYSRGRLLLAFLSNSYSR